MTVLVQYMAIESRSFKSTVLDIMILLCERCLIDIVKEYDQVGMSAEHFELETLRSRVVIWCLHRDVGGDIVKTYTPPLRIAYGKHKTIN